MNLLLIEPADLQEPGIACIRDRRHRHLVDIKGCGVGDSVAAGLLDGPVGTAQVIYQDADETRVQLELATAPPPPLPLTLVLALPRPKMLRRILRTVAELGIKDLYLIHSGKVEKSYWHSPVLDAATLHGYFIAGLEQVGDTQLPRCHLRQRFRPFVEDELPRLCPPGTGILAEPSGRDPWPSSPSQASTLVVGPEGGFTDFEQALLQAQGLLSCSLGPRIYRVETAIPVLASRLFPAPLP